MYVSLHALIGGLLYWSGLGIGSDRSAWQGAVQISDAWACHQMVWQCTKTVGVKGCGGNEHEYTALTDVRPVFQVPSRHSAQQALGPGACNVCLCGSVIIIEKGACQRQWWPK